jgi:hypothetical protein
MAKLKQNYTFNLYSESTILCTIAYRVVDKEVQYQYSIPRLSKSYKEVFNRQLGMSQAMERLEEESFKIPITTEIGLKDYPESYDGELVKKMILAEIKSHKVLSRRCSKAFSSKKDLRKYQQVLLSSRTTG